MPRISLHIQGYHINITKYFSWTTRNKVTEQWQRYNLPGSGLERHWSVWSFMCVSVYMLRDRLMLVNVAIRVVAERTDSFLHCCCCCWMFSRCCCRCVSPTTISYVTAYHEISTYDWYNKNNFLLKRTYNYIIGNRVFNCIYYKSSSNLIAARYSGYSCLRITRWHTW